MPDPSGETLSTRAQLELSEESLRLATDAAEVGVWDLDLTTGVLSWPPRTKAMFGISADASASMDDFYAGVHAGDVEATSAAFAAALDPAVRAAYDVEYRTVGKEDGVVRWVAAKGKGLFDAEGRCVRAIGTAIDITARKAGDVRAQALAELSERVRDLSDTAAISAAAGEVLAGALNIARGGYGTIDPITETITIERDWNAPGIRSLAGVLNFRDYGSYIEDLKHGETVSCADARIDPRTRDTAAALEAISARSFVNMPLTEAGGFVALLYANHDEPRAWSQDDLAFMREVAERTRSAVERRRAEAALRELNATLEARVAQRMAERDQLWALSQDMLARADMTGMMSAVSPAWEETLGWTERELLSRGYATFMHSEDEGPTLAALTRMTETGEPTTFENRIATKNGGWKPIEWTVTLEPDGFNFVAVGRDLSPAKARQAELEAAQDQLRQAQKMEAVGQLTGGVAHDFNNLLTGITGSLELLQARIAQGRTESLDRYITAASGAAKRAASLTQRLLAFSRRQTLDPRATDVNRLVVGMEELIRRTVGPAIEVEVVQAGGLWATLVDPAQLDNALLNLCINARDAMPEGGRLTIETANKWLDTRTAAERDLTPGQYVSLCVSDTGTGMTPEVVSRAFDPFFTTKPLGSGTGLGLSMIYGFVRQSGGQVRIYTELDKGTTMCLYLPRLHGAEEAVEPSAPPPPLDGDAGLSVLVVDDEPTVRMLVAEVLTDAGHHAIEATDGPTGLKILQSNVRIDLLVTDVGLPGGLNGRQVADAARVIRPGLKVLFITGYAENAAVGNGHLEPGMALLTKPFPIEDLKRRITELIEAPAA